MIVYLVQRLDRIIVKALARYCNHWSGATLLYLNIFSSGKYFDFKIFLLTNVDELIHHNIKLNPRLKAMFTGNQRYGQTRGVFCFHIIQLVAMICQAWQGLNHISFLNHSYQPNKSENRTGKHCFSQQPRIVQFQVE